jgi:hypothetical protein
MRSARLELSFLAALACAGGAGCSGEPSVPAQPTWADVSPILRAECSQCHGSTAATTGLGYRLDFYDMNADVCGDAARAMPQASILAAAAAPKIVTDVSRPANGGRERMPPLPGTPLHGWERDTLVRWATQPIKGSPPAGNHPPTIQVVGLPVTAGNRLHFTALLSDPDGDEVVGVVKVADEMFAMSRSGTFVADLDTSNWPTGTLRLSAVVCDGWSNVTYDLGPVDIKH